MGGVNPRIYSALYIILNSGLTAKQARIMVWHFCYGKDYTECADLLGTNVSVQAVQQCAQRALRTMRSKKFIKRDFFNDDNKSRFGIMKKNKNIERLIFENIAYTLYIDNKI